MPKNRTLVAGQVVAEFRLNHLKNPLLNLHMGFFLAAIPAILYNPARAFAVAGAGKELPLVALSRRCYQKANPHAGISVSIGAEIFGKLHNCFKVDICNSE